MIITLTTFNGLRLGIEHTEIVTIEETTNGCNVNTITETYEVVQSYESVVTAILLADNYGTIPIDFSAQ